MFNGESSNTFYILLDTFTVSSEGKEGFTINYYQILLYTYIAGSSFILLRFFYRLLGIYIIFRKGEEKWINNTRFIFMEEISNPFSFFNTIFINKEFYESEPCKKVIEHEMVHIRQKHSFDVLFMEILTVLQWFNPTVWMYKSSIKTIHEFLADEGVINQGYSINTYHETILSQLMGTGPREISNSFSSYKLKNRIIMMTKERSEKKARIKVLAVIPALLISAFLVSAISNATMAQEVKEILVENAEKVVGDVPPPPPPAKEVVEVKIDKPQKEKKVYETVDNAPQFKGGEKARIKYLVENIKYPASAKEKGITGTTYIQFVVNKDGSISDAKVLRGFDKECDAEALRVIKNMPNWVPGSQKDGKKVNVQFNMPIRFALAPKKEAKKK
jgi:TonB family protein